MKLEKERIDKAKRDAALEAVKLLKDNLIVGLGSGSTVAYAIEEVGNRIRRERLNLLCVPTSYQTSMLAVKHGVPITTLEEHSKLDLTIDGADQIDEKLDLIKGMGGALTREKVVASASKKLVIIAEESKKVKFLGENNHPVPIEVLPIAVSPVMFKIKEIGGEIVIREGVKKVGPVITDNGNFILDVNFGIIYKPAELERELKSLPGVIETGLFVRMADIIYLGKRLTVEKIERKED